VGKWVKDGRATAYDIESAIEYAEFRRAKPKQDDPDSGDTEQSSERDCTDDDELKSDPAFPYPKIDDAAFYGPFGRIVQAITPLTEVDPVGVLVALLIGWGT
jgi:hypothetical protein